MLSRLDSDAGEGAPLAHVGAPAFLSSDGQESAPSQLASLSLALGASAAYGRLTHHTLSYWLCVGSHKANGAAHLNREDGWLPPGLQRLIMPKRS